MPFQTGAAPAALNHWIISIFDSSPLGVVSVNMDRQILYANPKALEIFGVETWLGKTVRDLIPDQENLAIVDSQLAKRQKGLSDEYEVQITRFRDGKRIPVKVAAMPVMDSSGMVVGAIGIIRSLELERTIQAIDKHIQTFRSGAEILEAVAEETRKLVPFDLCTASVFSRDMKHARLLFSWDPAGKITWRTRWFHLTPSLSQWAQQRSIIAVGNLSDFFARPHMEQLADDEAVRDLLTKGFQSFVRYPVVRQDRVVGSVALISEKPDAFNAAHQQLLEALPLDEALLMALYYEEKEDILPCQNNKKVADLLVERLAEHYRWESVAIYRIDEQNATIELQSQKAKSEEFLLPEDYAQPANEGVLGYVLAHGMDANIGNVKRDPVFKDVFKRAVKGTNSELCMCIKVDGKVYGLLNIEDSRENAFSEEELHALRVVLNEVGALMERFCTANLIAATFEATPTAVFVINSRGGISRVNPATVQMLGYPETEMIGTPLRTYFKTPEKADAVLRARRSMDNEVTLLHRDGHEVHALLGGSQLEEGGMVVSAKDLSFHKRVEQLELLGQMYYEIAVQTKVPLSLVYNWLRELKADNPSGTIGHVLDKAIRQLRKAEITHDILTLYDKDNTIVPYNQILLDITQLIDGICREFPKTEIAKIEFKREAKEAYVRGDPFQVA